MCAQQQYKYSRLDLGLQFHCLPVFVWLTWVFVYNLKYIYICHASFTFFIPMSPRLWKYKTRAVIKQNYPLERMTTPVIKKAACLCAGWAAVCGCWWEMVACMCWACVCVCVCVCVRAKACASTNILSYQFSVHTLFQTHTVWPIIACFYIALYIWQLHLVTAVWGCVWGCRLCGPLNVSSAAAWVSSGVTQGVCVQHIPLILLS